MAIAPGQFLLTRPRAESEALAAQLAPLGLDIVILPAFEFEDLDPAAGQPAEFERLRAAGAGDLLVFTSPRAVRHGLAHFTAAAAGRLQVCAIGPSTARALEQAGLRPRTAPAGGYTSEALLGSLAADPAPAPGARAFIVAAPGGRETLAEGLGELGWRVHMLWTYRAVPAPLDREELRRLADARGLISVWTSGNTMKALAQRLPAAAWFRVCEGSWVVISERLERLARAYRPARIRRATGPDNDAIVAAVRGLLGELG